VLLHLVDCSGLGDPVTDLRAVRGEIQTWDPTLVSRPQLLVATKRDAIPEPDPLPALAAEAESLGLELVEISAHTGAGLDELKRRTLALLDQARAAETPAEVEA
jgi:GTP-binding protein